MATTVPLGDGLDSELEALFDTPVPASPPRQSRKPVAQLDARKSILDVLVVNQSRLTGHAAQIARDVATLAAPATSSAPERAPIREAMMQRRNRSSSRDSARATEEAKAKAKLARNAFKAVGRETAIRRRKLDGYVDPLFTNMALRDPVFNLPRLTALFENSTRIDVSEICKNETQIRTGNLPEFVIFACLVRKVAKKETKTGAKYAVWSVYNMPRGNLPGSNSPPPPTEVITLLFDDAYEAYHTQVPGSVYALRKPMLLPPRVGEAASRRDQASWSGYALRISKKEQLIPLGISKDFQLCESPGPDMTSCGAWYDSNRLKACIRHTRKTRTNNMQGTRMDINNAERPAPSRAVMEGVSAPTDISRPETMKFQSRYSMEGQERPDPEAELRRAQDREMTAKLNASRQAVAPKPRPIAAMGIQVAKRRDERRRLALLETTSANMRPQFEKGAAKDIHAKFGPKYALQKQYQQAVSVLRKCGFVLGADGSLTPQVKGRMKVQLMTTQDRVRDVVGLDVHRSREKNPLQQPTQAQPIAENASEQLRISCSLLQKAKVLVSDKSTERRSASKTKEISDSIHSPERPKEPQQESTLKQSIEADIASLDNPTISTQTNTVDPTDTDLVLSDESDEEAS